MLRKQQSRDNCDADENNHGDSALDPGSGDWRKRPALLSRRHWRVEHSDAGNFSRRKTSARRRCLRFQFALAVGEFVRRYPPCYSHYRNIVQRRESRTGKNARLIGKVGSATTSKPTGRDARRGDGGRCRLCLVLRPGLLRRIELSRAASWHARALGIFLVALLALLVEELWWNRCRGAI